MGLIMDPLTLFALANGAVSAVKAGCKLYKDIKGAAGEVKEVLKDLDEQFHALHPPEKPPTVEQRNQFIQEKNKVIELNKKANAGEHTTVYQELGIELGKYYDKYYKCVAIFEEEERRAATEIYTGDESLGHRALQRVLMRKQLEQMSVELRELMVYQSPPELGALHTEVEAMMKEMGNQQKLLIAQQMQRQVVMEKRRAARIKKATEEAWVGVTVVVAIFTVWFALALVVQDRIQKYPQYGNEWVPKTEEQRQEDAKPKVWAGR
jgi:Fe2+ transport system protein B